MTRRARALCVLLSAMGVVWTACLATHSAMAAERPGVTVEWRAGGTSVWSWTFRSIDFEQLGDELTAYHAADVAGCFSGCCADDTLQGMLATIEKESPEAHQSILEHGIAYVRVRLGDDGADGGTLQLDVGRWSSGAGPPAASRVVPLKPGRTVTLPGPGQGKYRIRVETRSDGPASAEE